MDSLLVLTGVDTVETALHAEPVRRPTFISPDLVGIAAPFPLPVVDGDGARCGAVSVRREGEDIAVVHGEADDPRVLRAVLALLRATHPEHAWQGRLLSRDGATALPAAAAAR